MKKHFVSIELLGIFVFCLCLFVVHEIGFPWDAEAERNDGYILNYLQQVSAGVDQFYIEYNHLPETKEELINNPNHLIISADFTLSDPPRLYDYKKRDDLNYELCATFQRERNESSIRQESFNNEIARPTMYGDKNVLNFHKKGYQCFTLTISSQVSSSAYQQKLLQPEKENFPDPFIKGVTTDAKWVTSSNFPYALFNTTDEWGLVNSSSEPIQATVSFDRPVAIDSITNLFGACSETHCYEWTATGQTEDGKTITLVSKTTATKPLDSQSVESKKETESKKEVTSVTFTITRLYTDRLSDRSVHWKKLSFEYYSEASPL